ncbi:MAG: hypothetical protein HYY46_24980 [Deltaproteobacteria bacterium]|nr:hypothetical protein [Deltaproteobacteria bacterium]
MDIFAGSNATGEAAEKLDRKWIAFEMEHSYLAASAFRSVDELNPQEARQLYSHLMEAPSMRKASYSGQKKRKGLKPIACREHRGRGKTCDSQTVLAVSPPAAPL